MQKITNLNADEQLVHIGKEFIEITSVDKNMVSTNKTIEHDDFLSILSSSMRYSSLDASSMMGFQLGSNIVKFRASENGFLYYLFIKKGIYPFNNEGKRSKIHYPNMIFAIGVDMTYSLKTSSIYVVKDEDINTMSAYGVESIMIKPNARMYRYPIGNVGGGGRICWGGITFPLVESYINVFEIINMFFNSMSNLDHSTGPFRDSQTRTEILSKLQDTPFEEDILEPMNMKFSDI